VFTKLGVSVYEIRGQCLLSWRVTPTVSRSYGAIWLLYTYYTYNKYKTLTGIKSANAFDPVRKKKSSGAAMLILVFSLVLHYLMRANAF